MQQPCTNIQIHSVIFEIVHNHAVTHKRLLFDGEWQPQHIHTFILFEWQQPENVMAQNSVQFLSSAHTDVDVSKHL